MLIMVDKPKGITSFDVVRALKRELQEKKIGHSGTLDPMATWLLLIGTDKDTKKLHELQWLDKSYTTTIDFSKNSDTRDMDYWEFFEELDIESLNKPTREEINSKLKSILPESMLPLTPFSAKKKEGKKLYELAREGKQEIEDKLMKVNAFEILNYDFPNLKLELNVGSGTYIRSIGYRLGKQLWLWGILTVLRRNSIWKYSLENTLLDKKAIFFHKEKGEIPFTYKILG